MDEIAWLIAREIPHLRRFARALTRDPAAADDLVQDTLERALRKRHLWLRRGSLRNWLLKMLYNLYLNGLGRRRRDRLSDPIEDDLPGRPVPASQDDRLELSEVMARLDLLPAGQRAAILLIATEDIGYEEAAGILGIPIGTLRSRLSRGREQLRRHRQGAPLPVALRRVK